MMIRLLGWGLAVVFFLFVIAASGEQAEPQSGKPAKTNVQSLMRDKLTHAQSVLDGIVTDDYDKVVEQAEMMRIISRAASWQAIDTDEYRNHSDRFQRITTELSDAAKAQNRDAVTLQYLKLTIGCIECHQYIHQLQNPRPAETSTE